MELFSWFLAFDQQPLFALETPWLSVIPLNSVSVCATELHWPCAFPGSSDSRGTSVSESARSPLWTRLKPRGPGTVKCSLGQRWRAHSVEKQRRQQLLAACGAPRAGCADLLSLLLPKGLVAAAGPPSYNESFIHLVVTWELTAKGGRSGRAVPYGSLCSGSREPAAGQPAIAMHNGCPSLPLSAWHRTVLFSL